MRAVFVLSVDLASGTAFVLVRRMFNDAYGGWATMTTTSTQFIRGIDTQCFVDYHRILRFYGIDGEGE